MNYEIVVSGLHGCADCAEQFQCLNCRKVIGLSIFVYRQTIYIFHDEIGKAVLGCAPVKETGDIWVIKVRKYLSLFAQAT